MNLMNMMKMISWHIGGIAEDVTNILAENISSIVYVSLGFLNLISDITHKISHQINNADPSPQRT